MAVQKVLRLCACYGSCAAVPFDVILPIWKLAAQQVWKPALRESKGLAGSPDRRASFERRLQPARRRRMRPGPPRSPDRSVLKSHPNHRPRGNSAAFCRKPLRRFQTLERPCEVVRLSTFRLTSSVPSKNLQWIRRLPRRQSDFARGHGCPQKQACRP